MKKKSKIICINGSLRASHSRDQRVYTLYLHKHGSLRASHSCDQRVYTLYLHKRIAPCFALPRSYRNSESGLSAYFLISVTSSKSSGPIRASTAVSARFEDCLCTKKRTGVLKPYKYTMSCRGCQQLLGYFKGSCYDLIHVIVLVLAQTSSEDDICFLIGKLSVVFI